MRVPSVSASRRAAVAAGALALAATAPAAEPAAAKPATAQRAIDLAVGGLGGERALRDLDAFRLRASGRTAIYDEGPRPDDTVVPASTFTVQLEYDLRTAGDRLRAESARTGFGFPRRDVTEVIVGRRGVISGQDGNFEPPQDQAMTWDRLAAIMREQRLLNPHLYVRPLLERPRLARSAGSRRLRGRRHRVLVVRGDVAPVRLFVDAKTGRIARLTTIDHNYHRGDVRTVVDYRRWRRAGGPVRFPRRVTLAQDGKVVHAETRSAMRANPRIADARFGFPPGIEFTLDRALADRGARTTEWIMAFAQAGFPTDGPATEIVPRAIAPGSTLLQGLTHHTMIVEQQDGIVVVEGVLHEFRAEAIIDYVERTFPGKPIRYVTGSHHHVDHSGGMRPFVALGARPVVHVDAVPFFEGVFADRSSRLLRDRLDRSDAKADILAVPATGTVTLPDPVRPVTVLAEPTEHATTTILVHVPSEGVLFVNGDTYTPALPPGPAARTLDQTIRSNGLTVNWIVGAHGDVIDYRDFVGTLPPA